LIKTKPSFGPNALVVLDKRYLQKQIEETPEQMLDRVAGNDPEYYELMAKLDFLPNSPTLFNKGTGNNGTFSACFVYDIPDSMDGIMDVAKKAARVQKAGGGVGYNFSQLRPKGAFVAGTGNSAGGPVIFLKMLNGVGHAVTQSGKRAAAQMGILHINHTDIREWITCKSKDPDSISTFNISVAATDEFMTGALISGTNEEGLLNEIAKAAWTTGDPGFYFIDEAERHNPTPHLGKLTTTNPCGEVPLLDNEPCNLGSINLRNIFNPDHINDDDKINWGKLEQITRTAVRFLDDILDANTFPDPAITDIAYKTRKLGLGVMGWADLLALLNIHYDSIYAVALAEDLMRTIQIWATDESIKLASKKGIYPGWKEGSPAQRNATVTCIAPTGTISILAGVSSGIEPHFRLKWTREMGDGTMLNEEADVLKDCNGFIPKTADEIPWEWHVKHQAAFQKYTDLAVSKTINLPNSATVEDVKNAYIMMWQLKCKGGTVFRDGCREQQVLRSVPEEPKIHIHDSETGRKRLPVDVDSKRHKFTVGEIEGYIHIGKYEDGNAGELFISAAKEGTTISGLLDALGILTSIALQRGITVSELSKKLQGVRFEPSGMTGNKDIPVATSVVDYIYRYLDLHFGDNKEQKGISSGMFCVECHGPATLLSGCLTCVDPSCSWSRCG
jgi:ribonucleoside-diphosphate reductase alpha chain